MKLSTRGRYGLRAMLDIALEEKAGPVAAHTIAKRQKISKKYLEQLLTTLKKAGLIKSVRGPQGGYVLGFNASEITAGDIIRALEGPIAPVDCISEINPDHCNRAQFCVTRQIWTRLRDSASQILDSYTLEDLLESFAACRNSAPTRNL
ncbi:MAG: Rrf2 family transcriptional regulator [Firmicutes bacterium]|nr:Rrf2 family transcriptional regulator [Bacillota bacterium]